MNRSPRSKAPVTLPAIAFPEPPEPSLPDDPFRVIAEERRARKAEFANLCRIAIGLQRVITKVERVINRHDSAKRQRLKRYRRRA